MYQVDRQLFKSERMANLMSRFHWGLGDVATWRDMLWLTVDPAPVTPSPNSHSCDTMPSSGSAEPVASKLHAKAVHDLLETSYFDAG